MTSLKQVKYEQGDYWVYETDKKTYEVYKNGCTCSTRVAIIGIKGEKGLSIAIHEIQKRIKS
jgi:hypothetical protein